MKLRSILTRTLLAGAMLTLVTTAAQAALITWGAPTAISGDDNVSTAGTLVGAFNIGRPGVADTTVNGTTFTGLGFSGLSVTSGNFNFSLTGGGFTSEIDGGSANPPFSLLSAPYRALLSSEAGSSSFFPTTLTMSGLTEGATYQFQWWSNHSSLTGSYVTTATAGDAVTLLSNTGGAFGGLGQFAVGTFVADATNVQTIVFSSTGGRSNFNGLQLRQTAAPVPEPTTALFGLALVGFCTTARRRTKARA